MIVFDPIKLAMLAVKIPSMVLSLILAFKIKKLSNYILNFLFFIAYVGWATFIGTDALLYVIAPWNEATYTLANILRDVGITMTGMIPLCFLQASFVIKEGEEVAFQLKRKRLIAIVLANFAITTGVVLFDQILVVSGGVAMHPSDLPPTGNFNVTFDARFVIVGVNDVTLPGFIAFIMYMSFIAWYIFSVGLISSEQRHATGIRRARNLRIIIGILMIPAGITYFVLLPFMRVPGDLQFIFNVIGQVIWASSSIFVYLGLLLKSPSPDTRKGTGAIPVEA